MPEYGFWKVSGQVGFGAPSCQVIITKEALIPFPWRRCYLKNYQKSDKLPQNYKSSKSARLLRSSSADGSVIPI